MRPHHVQQSQNTTPTGSIPNAGYLRIPDPQRWSRIILVSSPDTKLFARILRPIFGQGGRARAKNLVSGDETNQSHDISVALPILLLNKTIEMKHNNTFEGCFSSFKNFQ